MSKIYIMYLLNIGMGRHNSDNFIKNGGKSDPVSKNSDKDYKTVNYIGKHISNEASNVVNVGIHDNIIPLFQLMVKKTILFERFYIAKKGKLAKQLHPFLEEARDVLYRYYMEFLIDYLDICADPFLYEFIAKMQN